MPVAEATALSETAVSAENPAPYVAAYDADADDQALQKLAEWCEQFSPQIGIAEPVATADLFAPLLSRDSLLFDATGLGAWFGSEARWMQHVAASFRRQGHGPRLALADTIGTAWAVAHFGFGILDGEFAAVDASAEPSGGGSSSPAQISRSRCLLVPVGASQRALQRLPVEALRLSREAVDTLHQLGISHLEQLLALPRAELSARLGPEVLQRLDQARGISVELFVAHRSAPQFSVHRSVDPPTDRQATLQHVLQQLIGQLAFQLRQQNRSALRITVSLDCIHAEGSESFVAMNDSPSQNASLQKFHLDLFRPVTDPQHLGQLVQMQMEGVRLPGLVRAVQLHATTTIRKEHAQHELFADADHRREREFAVLVDRLNHRLGKQGVLYPHLQAEAQPECAYRLLPLIDHEATQRLSHTGSSAHTLAEPPAANDRPLQLHHPPLSLQVLAVIPDGPPLRFRYRNRWHMVARHWGPERIETGWWRGRSIRRDYYRVETTSGNRFWLFRQLDDDNWFLHGSFT
jgi:protein ImuB